MKVIGGYFLENQSVTVEIDGKQIERKVRYNRVDGLYIVYKNRKYFEYEFEYQMENISKWRKNVTCFFGGRMEE